MRRKNNKSKLKQKRKALIMQREKTVSVISAMELDSSLQQRVVSIFGKQFEYKFKVDPEVLGGIMIQQGDHLYDGTIKSQLHALKDKFIKN